ncbi:hypothetical protein [Plantactinospora endophytica]|uniref:Secreted protein n=1 Tax=Plantactinospora endophytica TaxID=673535 RepID=A0ABQ4E7M0_9ACTN|nr:hypothetical protein [Plantactinospora endophytica]GIG90665.1 hypothetical protein Pen02_56010 [Plantactinospora endophytica]
MLGRIAKTAIVLVVLGAATLIFVPATAASAATSCYGGAYNWDAGVGDDGDTLYIPDVDDTYDWWGARPYYRSSTRCADINLKVTHISGSVMSARVCFRPSSGGGWCNGWKTFDINVPGSLGTWRVIATDVRDNTTFFVEFTSDGYTYGQVAH